MHYGGTFSPQVRTAKELDEETGLYYYGARYLDPKYSMWISTDPALGVSKKKGALFTGTVLGNEMIGRKVQNPKQELKDFLHDKTNASNE